MRLESFSGIVSIGWLGIRDTSAKKEQYAEPHLFHNTLSASVVARIAHFKLAN